MSHGDRSFHRYGKREEWFKIAILIFHGTTATADGSLQQFQYIPWDKNEMKIKPT